MKRKNRKVKKQRHRKGNIMLGTFNNKLDKNISIISLIIISLITLSIASSGLFGVFNISGIMQGVFKSAYLGYYASVDFAGNGLMSKSLKLVLKEIFTTLDLHRIEANIQANQYGINSSCYQKWIYKRRFFTSVFKG